MKNVRLISLGIGLLIGGILGGVAVWSMTKNFVDRAVTAAEERFDSLLEEEKEKLQDKVDNTTKLKERLEATLVETEYRVNSLSTTIESTELDKLADYGYKTQKTGFIVGTTFEYRDDLSIGLASSNYYQNIETVSSASEAQKKQRGDYLDSYLKLDFDYDKRNQKFQTTSGFRSFYSVDVPLISDTDTLINSYNYQLFSELYEDNITSMSVFLNTANSITGSDVKLSERLYIPQSKLRGFKAGSVGPKDGNDYIGGNFVSTLNIVSTLPQIFENSQNTDFLIFFDAANVWHVDYDSSINDNSKIRSSIGVGVDWLTPIGPLNFSLSQPITKSSTDMTETFRFNLGTTF